METATSPSAPLQVTFMLPGRGRTGGVRVTVDLANELLRRGHDVRIVYRQRRARGLRRLRRWVARGLRQCVEALQPAGLSVSDDFLPQFAGRSIPYAEPNEIAYAPGEIVIAVGGLVVDDVRSITADIRRVRYCHGIRPHEPQFMQAAWGGPMPTIAVAANNVPELERLSGCPVLGVVRNGFNHSEYFVEDRNRIGIGTIYGEAYQKAPEFCLEVLNAVASRWPQLPQYVFGTAERPSGLPARAVYQRCPSVAAAREMYNRSLVWFLFSRYECLPAPILEGWACGSAVVSTDNTGGRELIMPGHNGELLPYGDVQTFVDTLADLLRDSERRQGLAARGLASVGAFTWPTAAAEMERVLRRLPAAMTESGRVTVVS